MKPSFKIMVMTFALALGPAVTALQAKAQDSAPAATPQDMAARERAAHDLVVEFLPASRMPEIYADIRRTVRNVYLPVLRDAASGDVPGMPAPDAEMADAMAKLLTFLTYALKASDEIEPVLAAERDAIISDIAALLAKHSSLAEIDNARELLRKTAARKGFDAIYALSRLATGFTYEETRSMQEFSAWARKTALGVSLASPPGEGDAPPPAKVAKAQEIVNDLLANSRLDDMAARLFRFAREVVLPAVSTEEEARADYKSQIDQYEFAYGLQKGVVIGVAPSVLAQTLTDEQLEKLHGFVRSPAFEKTFTLLFDAVRAATAFSVEDIREIQDFAAKAQASGKLYPRGPEEEAQAEADWEALRKKWADMLMASLSPETREGLERSAKELQGLDMPDVPEMPEKPL